MNNELKKHGDFIMGVNFSQLLDLRVDFAFKLIFGSNDAIFLISLLNAIFANKKINRVIKSLSIVNPHLERYSSEDKLAILDIRALLDDGSTILIEMHLYAIDELKYKTIRSWARAYGEELKASEKYSVQPPVICVAFVDGSIDDGDNKKIHKCCKILDIDDHTVFSDALELHYIDMKLFVKMINEKSDAKKGETLDSMLGKWLAIITEKDIEDKSIIKNICEEQEEIGMAVSTLAKWSEDVATRQAYQRRQDDIILSKRRELNYEQKLEEKDATIAEQARLIAELRSRLGEK